MKKATNTHTQISAFGQMKLSKTLFAAILFALLTIGAGNTFAAPVPAITGYYFYMCQGATAPFFDDAPGGVWSISPATASVASVSAGGIVTGLSSGTATLSYTVGGSSATTVVTVYPTPGPIRGSGGICLSRDDGGRSCWSVGKENFVESSLLCWQIGERTRFICPAGRTRSGSLEISLLRAKDSAPCAVLL